MGRRAAGSDAADRFGTIAEIEAAMRLQQWMSDKDGSAATVSHLAAGQPFSTAPRPKVTAKSRARRERVRLEPLMRNSAVLAAAIARQWRWKSQIACVLDATMTTELLASTTEKLPTSIFRRLRYVSPLIVFEEPIESRTVDDLPCRILGYYVYGGAGGPEHTSEYESIVPTNEARVLGLMIVSAVEYDDFGATDYEINRMTIPLTSDVVHLDDLTDEIADRYVVDEVSALATTRASARALVAENLRISVKTLLYLCAKNADVQEPGDSDDATTAQTGRSRRAKTVNGTIPVRLGWRIGAQLRKFRAGQLPPRESVPTGRGGYTLPPRQVSGHPKFVRVGPGRRERDLIWIDPYWTHRDQIGWDTTKSTAVPVRQAS